METVVVCASGFTSEEKASIAQKVEHLKGKFEADLTQSASVLIAKHHGTMKTVTSIERNIPIVCIK